MVADLVEGLGDGGGGRRGLLPRVERHRVGHERRGRLYRPTRGSTGLGAESDFERTVSVTNVEDAHTDPPRAAPDWGRSLMSKATVSVTNVEDVNRSTRLLAQTTLRNVLGTKNLSEILSDRENISHFMQVGRQTH